MHPVLFIILVLIAVVLIGKLIWRQVEKREKRKAQKKVDENIEKQLEDYFSKMKIETLAKHSDKERMARIASARIEDYIKMAAHPKKLSNLFQNLGLFTATRNRWSTKEIELAALIQQYTLRNIDAHDMRVYQSEVCTDRKQGFTELNKSFLTKVHDDLLIWSPLN